MFEELLEKLCKDLSIAVPQVTKEAFYPIVFSNTITIRLFDLHPGVAMKAPITTCMKQKREDLFIFIMRANLLGQGTGECHIGLDPEEKYLTLSLGLPYEMNYSLFKEKFEDFVNYLVYWKEEIEKFEQKQMVM